MKEKWAEVGRNWRIFVSVWADYGYVRVYRVFAAFERLKRGAAKVLYSQRGRYVRPFIHSAMMGTIALGLSLAPVLASAFPGIEAEVEVDVTREVAVMEAGDLPMATEVAENRLRDQVIEHRVEPGETLSAIAVRYGVSVDTLRWENNLQSVNNIKPGQVLRVLPVTGVRHIVGRGETVYTIAKRYGSNPQAIVDFPFNTFADNETFALAVGQELIVPDGEKPNVALWSAPKTPVMQRTPDAGQVSGSGLFAWPISGVITQRFSWYHRGIDVAAPLGTPVLAADAGRVTAAGWPDNSGYGNRVILDHGNGYTTLYAHLSKVAVVVGQTVKRGDVLGLEGSTGRSTGPHLHFEIKLNGVFQNPLNYLK